MDALKRFQDLMRDLFQFDMSDLDFGMYRLLRLKRDEIEIFLKEQLPRKVDEAFASMAQEEKAVLKASVDELAGSIREKVAEDAIAADGQVKYKYRESAVKFVEEIVAKYEEAREKLTATDAVEADKVDVFNHLYNFFSRYYEAGDFIPKRRYGARETYAVPYDGSEVFFTWANRDQHYVKTAETFKDYAFTVEGNLFSQGDWRVRFVLTEAAVPKDNVKGNHRFFFPSDKPVEYDSGNLVCRIPFEYRPPTDEEIMAFRKTDKGKYPDQRIILESRFADLLNSVPDENLQAALSKDQRTQAEIDDNKPQMPLLLRRMLHYARRNTSDYFIHKNLRRFLLEEFQFYIKDQVLHIEDLEGDFDTRRRMIQTLRRLGEQVIEFLAQIEDAQKRLFEKKKFVLETSYLIPIRHIPREFLSDILANADQKNQWKDWFALKPKKDLFNQKGEINEAFLEQHPTLIVDTRHFDNEWTRRLLESLPFEDLDDATDGLLVHSENFQALRLLQERYKEQVKCIYIDPPYNTDASPIIYKNSYKDSSWLALMDNRIKIGKFFLSTTGIQCTTVDDVEFHRLREVISRLFGEDNIAGVVAIKNNPSGRSTVKGFSIAHEYAIFSFSSVKGSLGMVSRTEGQLAQYREEDDVGFFQWRSFLRSGGANDFRTARPKLHYPLLLSKGQISLPELIWNTESQRWQIAENIDNHGELILPVVNGVEYTWRLGIDSLRKRLNDLRFRKARNGKNIIEIKFRMDDEGVLPKTVWDDKYVNATAYGTTLLRHIMGASQVFSFPKSVYAVEKCLRVCGIDYRSTIIDYFAGSGTSGHAVINLNREDLSASGDGQAGDGQRKFILVEMGEYFDTVLLPRIAKVMFTPEWKEGKPKRMATPEEAERTPRLVKVLRLESYEDALNNVAGPANMEKAASREKAYREVAGEDEYRLKYLVSLPLESSETMLNLAALEHPFDYTLEILTEKGPVRKSVDLMETFNYLYGLRVQKVETWVNEKDRVKLKYNREKMPRKYRVIRAMDREQKRRMLVVWRDMIGLDPVTERKFLEAKVKDLAANGENYDEHLINGDTAAAGFVSLDPLFKRLMLAGEEEIR